MCPLMPQLIGSSSRRCCRGGATSSRIRSPPLAPTEHGTPQGTWMPANPVATGSGCRSSQPLPLPWCSPSPRWLPTAPPPTRPCGRSPRSSTANTQRPSAPPTMRALPRRKPKRQWRQDKRTRLKPRFTPRLAAYHKCAMRTVRPNYRTDSATWKGSLTLPPGLLLQGSRYLSPARRRAARKPLLRPSRHRGRQRTPRDRKARQRGQMSLMTPLRKPGPQRLRRGRTQPLSPLRRSRHRHRTTSNLASRHGQPGPPPRRRRNQLRVPRGPTPGQRKTVHEGPNRSSRAARSSCPPHHSRRRRRPRAKRLSHPPQYVRPQIDRRRRPQNNRTRQPQHLDNTRLPRQIARRHNIDEGIIPTFAVSRRAARPGRARNLVRPNA